MKKDLGIDLDDFRRVLSNLNDSVVSGWLKTLGSGICLVNLYVVMRASTATTLATQTCQYILLSKPAITTPAGWQSLLGKVSV